MERSEYYESDVLFFFDMHIHTFFLPLSGASQPQGGQTLPGGRGYYQNNTNHPEMSMIFWLE